MSVWIFHLRLYKKRTVIIVFTMDTVLKPMNIYNFDLFIQEKIYIT